jgi:hypothetical protein
MRAAAPKHDAAHSAWTNSGVRLAVPRVLHGTEAFSESLSILGEGPSWNPEAARFSRPAAVGLGRRRIFLPSAHALSEA